MENFTIPSTRKVEGSFENEPCEVTMEDFDRLAYLALSLNLTNEDMDISIETSYYKALKRFFKENNNQSLNDLKEVFNNIKDDMITSMVFTQNIRLMIFRSNIKDAESYESYMREYDDFQKSLRGNKFQKQNPDINTFMSRLR